MTTLIKALNRVVAGIEDTDYPYYHVSDHPKLPTKSPKPVEETHRDPAGIYFFPKGYEVDVTDTWRDKKYRWDAKLKHGTKLLDLDQSFHDEFLALLRKIGIKGLEALYDRIDKERTTHRQKIDFQEIWDDFDYYKVTRNEEALEKYFYMNPGRTYDLIRDLVDNGTKLAQLFNSIGYDGLIDTSDQIYQGEPQLVIWNTDKITWGPREENIPDDDVYVLAVNRVVASVTEITEEEFFEANNIDPEDLHYMGSGHFGEAYLVGDEDNGRILKKTSSRSEYRIAKKLLEEKTPAYKAAFAEIYAVGEIKGSSHSYYILQEQLETDSDIEDTFVRLQSVLETQNLPIQYLGYFDEEEYIESGEELDPELKEFMEELEDVLRGYRNLGIEASDIQSDNLGRDKSGKLKAFDIDDRIYT